MFHRRQSCADAVHAGQKGPGKRSCRRWLKVRETNALPLVHALPSRWRVIAVHEPTASRHARSSSWLMSWPRYMRLHRVPLEPNPYGGRASVSSTGITPGLGMRRVAPGRWTGDVAHEPHRLLRAACGARRGRVGEVAHRCFPITADRREYVHQSRTPPLR
jgi:hypothetical protein